MSNDGRRQFMNKWIHVTHTSRRLIRKKIRMNETRCTIRTLLRKTTRHSAERIHPPIHPVQHATRWSGESDNSPDGSLVCAHRVVISDSPPYNRRRPCLPCRWSAFVECSVTPFHFRQFASCFMQSPEDLSRQAWLHSTFNIHTDYSAHAVMLSFRTIGAGAIKLAGVRAPQQNLWGICKK